jgi:hypothetical protein
MIVKIIKYLEEVFKKMPKFTGSIEINFKDGKLMDITEIKRTRFTEQSSL